MNTTINAITCHKCKERFEFDDDGTTQCMPDGYLVEGNWYCDDCGQVLELD